MSSGSTAAAGETRSPHPLRYIVLRLLAAALVAAAAFAADRTWLSDEAPRNTFGAKVKPYEVESDLLGRSLPARVVVPKRAPPKDRALVVFLHGRGENERSYLVDPMFEALASLRGRAPVIAFPRGGESSYWHNRDSGPWASYVLGEVVPDLVRRFDVDPDRVAIGGISMGGFGAFDIARLDPGRFCAVGGHSPALWQEASETADGAFDDADDFARNDVISLAGSPQSPYSGLRVWLDAGDDDPFVDGYRALAEAIREAGGHPTVRSSPGGHDNDYWNANWREYLGFYARALGDCAEEESPAELDGKPGARKAPGAGPGG